MSSLNDQHSPRFYIFCITTLEMSRVDTSENLLSASVAAAFVHLEILKVYQCELMKEVVVTKELLEGRTTSTETISFPALKHISLKKLSKAPKVL